MDASGFSLASGTMYAELQDKLAVAELAVNSSGKSWYVTALTMGITDTDPLAPDSSVVAAVHGNLVSDRGRLARLAPQGEVTLGVLSGDYSPDTWRTEAQLVRDDIDYASQQLKLAAPSWDRVWSEVVYPSTLELVAGAKAAAQATQSSIPWVAAAVIALVLGYVVLVFHPR